MRNLLVLTDYPIGYPSGFGETLFNLLVKYPEGRIWNAHPRHLQASPGKTHGQSIPFSAPLRPTGVPQRLSHLYFPVLKIQQRQAKQRLFRQLSELIERQQITALLTCPVSPWLLSAALKLKKNFHGLKVILFVMDDWKGHHQCYNLPFTPSRRITLASLIDLAAARFAVSEEMAETYKREFGVPWDVLHNGVSKSEQHSVLSSPGTPLSLIRLMGDINVFRFDAVLNFARGVELYNQTSEVPAQLEIRGTVSKDCQAPLRQLKCVRLLPRTDHATCLKAMGEGDLLYLPMSFGATVTRIANFSLPTKLPEYLKTYRPIFFHAPETSAVFKFAERWDLEPRLASATPTSVRDKLARFSSGHFDFNLHRVQAGLNREFDIDALQNRLYEALA